MASVKLGGWQRIGVVLSVIWFVGVFGYVWNDAATNANDLLRLSFKMCNETRSSFNHSANANAFKKELDKADAAYKACNEQATKRHREAFDGMYAGIPLILGLDLVSVVVLWGVAWAISATTRWVKLGFTAE